MNAFPLQFFEADKPFFEGACESLIFPAEDGAYGIQAGHRNFIAAVVPGMLSCRLPDGTRFVAAVSGGMVKVEDGRVLVLADSAERLEEIDLPRARRAADRARERILQSHSPLERRLAQAELARALNRLKIGEKE